jgi:hypothetical protein
MIHSVKKPTMTPLSRKSAGSKDAALTSYQPKEMA